MTADQPLFRRHALLFALLAAGIVFVLWNIPQLEFILYPFRLFVTFVHEAGHSLMALASGGRVIGFEVFSNGGGIATTAGGSRLLILPAGYLGAALFGAVLFYLTNRVPYPRKISLVLGTLLILVSLYLRATNIALVVGVLSGLALVFLALRGSVSVNIVVLNVLALMTGLNAVLDLLFLAQNSGASMGDVRNDAAAFSALTLGIPAAVWALVWAALAVLMLAAAAWFSIGRHMRDEVNGLLDAS
jgi:hypothetical protein